MIFHQRLRDIREDNDKTQAQIAEIIGTIQQQYSLWERGIRQMPIENYKILAEFYNISIDYLAGLIDTPHRLH